MIFRHPFGRFRCAGAIRIATAIAALACLSCAPTVGHPPVYPVTGKVTYQGKPLAEGYVVYELEGGGDARGPGAEPGAGPLRGTGRIRADGTFELRAFPGVEGMPEGHYRVGITSRPGRTEAGILGAGARTKKGNPDVLRGRYSDPRTSGLKGDVVKDRPNEPTFDLKSLPAASVPPGRGS